MLKINRQIHTLYLNSALGAFRIAGASWVALLAARGFSLVEIGLAESVFHMTSLIFEIPSGVISDVFGRKRSMMISQGMMILSGIAMLLSDSMAGVLVAMVLTALSFNFASGTREALAYDSMKLDGIENNYDIFSSTETIIYRISAALATLCAGLALTIGYRRAYTADIIIGAVCLIVTARLKEVMPAGGNTGTATERIRMCFAESIRFLAKSREAVKIIFLSAAVGSAATLLGFFIQARLPESGLPNAALGPALFAVGMGGAAGAKFVMRFRDRSYGRVFAIAAVVTASCTAVSFIRLPAVMILCALLAAMFDDFLAVRTDVQLNGMVPSEQRATLMSVSSLCFSMIMIAMSPALGALYSLL
jgi:MFS family permease